VGSITSNKIIQFMKIVYIQLWYSLFYEHVFFSSSVLKLFAETIIIMINRISYKHRYLARGAMSN